MVKKNNSSGPLKSLALSGAVICAMAAPAFAQPLNTQVESVPQYSQLTSEGNIPIQRNKPADARAIIGQTLVNQNGAKIGDVSDILRSKVDHDLYALIALGKAGNGKVVTIPYSDITVMPDEIMVQSDLNASDYALMPSYRAENYTTLKGPATG
ncbi:MAG TPA: PRC-barrel domain-containing protein [Alphaproteobacteria bacterium]|nr:PRC-barrel domain-containing protein [Alphaproteobacteria bacterium]